MLLGAGLVSISTAFQAAPSSVRVPGNDPGNASAGIPGDITAHNSPTVVRNPRNGDELAVANRIDTPRFSCALHVSSDGGATWRQPPIPAPKGEEPKCYAPDVAYGADGTLYVSFVTLQGTGNEPSAAWLSRSTDGGRTLSTPAKILGPLSFQVRLVADPSRPKRLFVTWLAVSEVGLFRFTSTGNPVMFKRSDDGGATWSSGVRVSDAARPRVVAGSLAPGSDGVLHVIYLDLADDRLDHEGGHEGEGGPPFAGRWKLVLSRSTDGGQTWRERVVEERLVPTERFVVFIPPYPSLAVDGRRVYAAFQDGRSGDADVLLWASEDAGTTFAPPVRVNDTPPGDGTSQYLPKLAVAPDGRLDVAYYDRRRDPANTRNEVSLRSSFDQGRTFTRRVDLAERSFDARIGFGSERGLPDLGSRLGLVATESAAFAVWTDTRAGTPASSKQDIARAVVAFSQPARLSGPVEYALRIVGVLFAIAGLASLVRARPRTRRIPA